jgi:aspartate carbamoyltransferase catalytic subunit
MMKHLRSAADLDAATATLILDTAAEMAALAGREVKKLPTLRGRTVVNLFYEDSTRTRISFEAAAKRLSADVINFSAKGSSVSKGESLKDTALTLQAMGADAVVIRHRPPARRTGSRPGWTARWSTPATAPTSTRPRRCSTRTRCAPGLGQDLEGRGSRSSATCCTAGSPAPTCCCCHARRRGHPGRAADAAAGRRRALARTKVSYDLDACCPRCDVVMMLRVQPSGCTARSSRPRGSTAAATASTARGCASCPSTRSSCTPAR